MTSIAGQVEGVARRRGTEDGLRALRRGFGWICLGGGALVGLYWLLYLTGAVALGQEEPLVASFESAFPLADSVMAAVLVGAGIALVSGHEAGPFLLTAGAAMSAYLGLLDLTFYGRLGAAGGFGAALQAALNAISLVGGTAGLLAAWRLRRSG